MDMFKCLSNPLMCPNEDAPHLTPDQMLINNILKSNGPCSNRCSPSEIHNFEHFQLLAASLLQQNSTPQSYDIFKRKLDEDNEQHHDMSPVEGLDSPKLNEDDSITPNDFDNLKRYRTSYTQHQTKILEESFKRERYISRPQRAQLAKELKLPENTIKVWFQNRRMKEKRQSMMLPNIACNDPQLRETLLKVAQMYYSNRYGTQEKGQIPEQKIQQILLSTLKKEQTSCSSPESDSYSIQDLPNFHVAQQQKSGNNSTTSSDEVGVLAESSTDWSLLSTSPNSGSPVNKFLSSPAGLKRGLNPFKSSLELNTKCPRPSDNTTPITLPQFKEMALCWQQICQNKYIDNFNRNFNTEHEKKRTHKPFTVEATLTANDD